MSALDPLIGALRKASAPVTGEPPTRLATVTGTSAGTVNVRFDGEASASSRAYLTMYGPAVVGDRVVMLRAGSTWVALNQIPGRAPDSTWQNATMGSGWGGTVKYRYLNGVVFVNVAATKASWATNEVVATIPVGYRPDLTWYSPAGFNFNVDAAWRGWFIDTAGQVKGSPGSTGSIGGATAYPAAT